MRARLPFLLIAMLLVGCGDGGATAPTLEEPLGKPGTVRTGPWALGDCPNGGPAPMAFDRLDDLTSNTRIIDGKPVEVPNEPAEDLVRAQVSSGSGYVCVEFEAAAEPEGEHSQLLMREPGKDDSGGLVTLEVTALEGPEPEGVEFDVFKGLTTPTGYVVHTNAPAPAADLTLEEELPDLPEEELYLLAITAENAVSGVEVRQRGRVVSVVAPWTVFGPYSQDLVRDFEWTAENVYTPPEEERQKSNLQFHDCIPEGLYRASLRTGRRVRIPLRGSASQCL